MKRAIYKLYNLFLCLDFVKNMLYLCLMKDNNRQSAAKPLLNEEGSTTIPTGSTGVKTGKRQVYLKIKNVIYKITNTVNGKFYIGSASYYDKRIGTHISLLRQKKHKNPYLQNAWDKYGEDAFKFEVIEQLNKQYQLLEREQYWLDYTQCYKRNIGYNCAKIAGSNLGMKLSKETKQKISNYWKGRPKSKKHIEKFIEVQTKMNGKPVIQYDSKMNFIQEYKSISEASRVSGMSITCISRQCSKLKGKLKPRQFIFRYKDIV